MTELTKRIAALTPEQRRLLEKRLQAFDTKRVAEENIPRQTKRDAYPLSYSQQRLWFLDVYNQGSPFYNFSLEYRILGPLDTAALVASLGEIVRRHEALRTIFILDAEQPLQIVQHDELWSAQVTDLQFDPDGAERKAESLLRQAAGRAFDLAKGPLFHANLLRLAPEGHILQIVVHHIVFDGWSMEILIRELESLYTAFLKSRSSPLPDLPIQYGDFAVWQREQLQGERLREHLEYWKKTLADLVLLDIATDRPRPHQQTYHGAVSRFELPATTGQFLADWSNKRGATLFMTLLAAVNTLLWHRTGQTDIAIGTAVANRNRVEIEGLIGFFVNTLALRTDLAGDPSFSELVKRVREVVLTAQDHQELPFEKLVEELQTSRDPSRNPLVQILFVLQQGSFIALPKLANLHTEQLSYRSLKTTRFDLEFHLWEIDGGVEGLLIYNTDLFDPSTAERLSVHLKEILSAAADAPQTRISDLPRMGLVERVQILSVWSHGQTTISSGHCLHELFTGCALRAPDSVALVWRDEELTYRTLDRRSNHLAHCLTTAGVRPSSPIALLLDRSASLIVSMLGVLKAGGAYLPLDPTWPKERLRFLIEDAGVDAVVTEYCLREALPAVNAQVFWFEDAQGEKDFPPSAFSDPDQLAYIMYTSGSTGTPKGVMVTHRAVVRLVKGCDYAQLGPDEIVLHFCQPSFDGATFEVWGALLNGGRLVVFPSGPTSLEELGKAIRQHELTTLWLTAGLFHAMVEERLQDLGSLRQLLAGGDMLGPTQVRRVLDQIPGLTFINGYGPTEATTFTCCHVMKEAARVRDPVSIGRPIANTEVLVLTQDLRAVPVGTNGELCIGGDGVALGYLARPQLTADRFVPDPFADEPGARLYRTGDRVRWLADGTLEFLGRLDQQVKVRGFRVEPGEIESVLLTHAEVRQAVVVARTDNMSLNELVVYVVGTAGESPEPRALREYLRSRLPEYMVPGIFVVLEELPLTSNGKIDRRALPQPDQRSSGTAPHLPPRDTIELRCTEIWEEVLGVSPIGIRANFFELGGHSIRAFVAMTRIGNAFGRELPIPVLFERPTIEQLAALLRSETSPIEVSPLVPLQTKGSLPPFFCVHPAGGNVLCLRPLARSIGDHRMFYGLQSRGLIDREPVVRSVEEMAADYLEAVRLVQPKGPYFFGGYCLGGVIALEMARQARQHGEDVAQLVLIDTYSPDAMSKEEFDDALALSWFARDLGISIGKRLSIPPDELRGLAAEQALSKVLIKARQEDVLPEDLDVAQLQRYFYCYLANSVAVLCYEPGSYSGHMTMMRARDEIDKYNLGPTLGWNSAVDCEIEIEDIPGDHTSIIQEPNVQVLAERICWVFSGAQRGLARQPVLSTSGDKVLNHDPVDLSLHSLDSSEIDEVGMVRLRHSYDVQRPVESVFAFLSNPRLEVKWNPWIREVRLAENAVVQRGMTFEVVCGFMGRTFEMRVEIEQHVESRHITFRVLEGPFFARTNYCFHLMAKGITRVEVNFFLDPKDFFGLIPRPLLCPIFLKSLRDDCRRQKDLLVQGDFEGYQLH